MVVRDGAAVARWAHNPKVGSSNLPPATETRPDGPRFSSLALPLGRCCCHDPGALVHAPKCRIETLTNVANTGVTGCAATRIKLARRCVVGGRDIRKNTRSRGMDTTPRTRNPPTPDASAIARPTLRLVV